MSDQEIYNQAVTKAVNNGCNFGYDSNWTKEELIKFITEHRKRPDITTVIFDHYFAKAFFGDDNIDPISIQFSEKDFSKTGGRFTLPGKIWQFQLMQMALADNPIAYLAKFL